MNIDENDDLIFFLTSDIGERNDILPLNNDQTSTKFDEDYKQFPYKYLSFDTKFDKPIYFINLYECALIKIILPGLFNPKLDIDADHKILTVLCNIVEPSYVNNIKLSILRQFYIKKHQPGEFVFSHPVYIPLRHHEIDNIHIEIIDENYEKVIISEYGPTVCVLKLRRIEEI